MPRRCARSSTSSTSMRAACAPGSASDTIGGVLAAILESGDPERLYTGLSLLVSAAPAGEEVRALLGFGALRALTDPGLAGAAGGRARGAGGGRGGGSARAGRGGGGPAAPGPGRGPFRPHARRTARRRC